jgi:hypothetical protein
MTIPGRPLPAITAAAVDSTACTQCWAPAGFTCPPVHGEAPATHAGRLITAYQTGKITGAEFRTALHAVGVFTIETLVATP